MEGKTTKMLAIVAVIGLCAVALIGAGYAAFQGTAKTYNEDNSIVAGNILITNGTYTPMVNNAKEVFNTYTYNDSGDKVAYYLNAPQSVHGLTAAAVGSEKSFTVTNNTGAAITKMQVGAKASAEISTSDYTYFFTVNVGESTVAFIDLPTSGTDYATTGDIIVDVSNEAEVQSLADGGNVTVTLQLYIGYTANKYIPDSFIGAPVAAPGDQTHTIAALYGSAPADIADVDFGFVVSDTSA